MILRHAALAGLAVLALAGCSEREAQERQALTAKTDMVGTSEARLLSCAGTPTRTRTVGSTKFLTYESADMRADQSALVGGFGAGGGIGGGAGMGIGVGIPLGGSATAPNYCEATFTVVDGRVAEVKYNTSGGYKRTAQCYDIVASCTSDGTFDPGPAPAPK